MSNQTTALQTNKEERGIAFVPFGASDQIKLSVKIIQNIVAVPTKSGRTCSERDALRFMMLCQAQRLNPFAGDAFLVGYDSQNGPSFSLITAHQAFLKRAETCPDYEGMESGVIIHQEDGSIVEREGDFHLEDESIVGGWAKVHRKGRKDTYRRIRMARFNNGFAQWKVDAAGMIVKCAEADALRSTFPTLLGGLYMQGELDGAGAKIVSEISTNRGTFEPKSLVETTNGHTDREPEEPTIKDEGEGTDLAPQRTTAATPAQPAASAKKDLELLVLNEGFTLSQLLTWGSQSGNIDNADSIPDFDSIPEAVAKRLMRAKAGLLRGLADSKASQGKAGE